MATYSFNHNVLTEMLNSEDEMLIDIANDAMNDFHSYAKTVLLFEENIHQYRQESPENYRVKAKDLDTKRHHQHQTCLTTINMLNRVAQNEFNSEPFCDLQGIESAMDVNRTDLGNAVLYWAYEHCIDIAAENLTDMNLTIPSQQPTNELNLIANKTSDPKQEIMNNYNQLFRDNPYPMIKLKDESYQFIHFTKGEPLSPDQAIQRAMNVLTERKLLNHDTMNTLRSAYNQTTETITPLHDNSHIIVTATNKQAHDIESIEDELEI